jgi:hypothetical protein
MATATAADYSTTTAANGLYYPLSSNPASYLVAADIAGKADLASPTFTGTPSLPTGTIGVTQTAGNNTTALATTAFVQQEVPDFATAAQAALNSSATTVISPSIFPFAMSNGLTQRLDNINNSFVSSGSVLGGFPGLRQMVTSTVSVAGRASFQAGSIGLVTLCTSAGSEGLLNFSKKIWLCGKFVANINATYVGDSNGFTSISLGGYTTNTSTGAMTVRGIGLKKIGGSASVIELVVHNGTSQSTVSTTKTCSTAEVVEYLIYSDGTGNVQLYLNGTLEASSASGPTGNTGNYQGVYREQVEQTASAAVRVGMNSFGGQVIIER